MLNNIEQVTYAIAVSTIFDYMMREIGSGAQNAKKGVGIFVYENNDSWTGRKCFALASKIGVAIP